MFLFLSKLLPLLLYPIGLTLLLLVIAAVILKRRPRSAQRLIIAAALMLWVSSSDLVSGALVKSLERQNLPAAIPTAAAMVVLGGATHSQRPPRSGVEVNEAGDRVIYAAQLYREGKAPKVILTGGRIAWHDGGSSESADMAQLLEPMGVPRRAILEDPEALNTRENAVNVQKILQQQGIQDFLLITSAIHMPRSLMIFRKLGMTPIPAPTDFLKTDVDLGRSTAEGKLLLLLPDAGNLAHTTQALKEYLGILIYRLKGWA
jgi:uncharacterized SAM-binding protein YcdF (DUF218 family)